MLDWPSQVQDVVLGLVYWHKALCYFFADQIYFDPNEFL